MKGPCRSRDIQPVHIRRNAWIGSDCTIFKGVTIGEGAIIGSRSVVVSDVPDGTVVMGNPARVIGSARGPAKQPVTQRPSSSVRESRPDGLTV